MHKLVRNSKVTAICTINIKNANKIVNVLIIFSRTVTDMVVGLHVPDTLEVHSKVIG